LYAVRGKELLARHDPAEGEDAESDFMFCRGSVGPKLDVGQLVRAGGVVDHGREAAEVGRVDDEAVGGQGDGVGGTRELVADLACVIEQGLRGMVFDVCRHENTHLHVEHGVLTRRNKDSVVIESATSAELVIGIVPTGLEVCALAPVSRRKETLEEGAVTFKIRNAHYTCSLRRWGCCERARCC